VGPAIPKSAKATETVPGDVDAVCRCAAGRASRWRYARRPCRVSVPAASTVVVVPDANAALRATGRSASRSRPGTAASRGWAELRRGLVVGREGQQTHSARYTPSTGPFGCGGAGRQRQPVAACTSRPGDGFGAERGVPRGDRLELGQGRVAVDREVRPGTGHLPQVSPEDRRPLGHRHLDQPVGPGASVAGWSPGRRPPARCAPSCSRRPASTPGTSCRQVGHAEREPAGLAAGTAGLSDEETRAGCCARPSTW
jgi:hypothetical protein